MPGHCPKFSCTTLEFCQAPPQNPQAYLYENFPPLNPENLKKAENSPSGFVVALGSYLVHGAQGLYGVVKQLHRILWHDFKVEIPAGTLASWRGHLASGAWRMSPRRSLMERVLNRREFSSGLFAMGLACGSWSTRKHPFSLWVPSSDHSVVQFYLQTYERGVFPERRVNLTKTSWEALRPHLNKALAQRVIEATCIDPPAFCRQPVRQFLAILPLGAPDVFNQVRTQYKDLAEILLRSLPQVEKIKNGHVLVHLGAVCEHAQVSDEPSRFLALNISADKQLFLTKEQGIGVFYNWFAKPGEDEKELITSDLPRLRFVTECSPDLKAGNFQWMPWNGVQSAAGYMVSRRLCPAVRAAWQNIDDSQIIEILRRAGIPY